MDTRSTSSPAIITRTVWLLSLVSLFNDIGSEMLIPVMPVFLRHIGFTVIFIGILEGIAEAVAGLSKSYFGHESDRAGSRLPFVQLGYALSAISKPLLALYIYPLWIFFVRTLDRLGKGIRTGARDALLSEEATPQTRGRVFGFHRSLDTIGAVLGPALALLYLYYHPAAYQQLFLITFIPGLLVIALTFFIKEKTKPVTPSRAGGGRRPLLAFVNYWKTSPATYRKLLYGLLLFALFNSADAFLLLKMKDSGMTDTAVIGVYIFYNICFAVMAYPMGALADKIGIKKIYITGLLLFAIVYTGFAFSQNLVIYFILFFLYGCYQAATDGIAKAWISNLIPRQELATAIGTYAGFQSIAALLASSICGFLWFRLGPAFAFCITAFFALVAALYLYFSQPKPAEIP
ncbi:MAG: MFS transporter [Ferruginibacter sp.]